MDRLLAWAIAAPAALAGVGLAAGAATSAAGLAFGPGALVAVLSCATVAASGVALQAYRRGIAGSALVAALGGAFGAAGYFGALLGPIDPRSTDPLAALVFLGLVPVVVACMSAASAMYLARGVRQYRERHGLRHAPR